MPWKLVVLVIAAGLALTVSGHDVSVEHQRLAEEMDELEDEIEDLGDEVDDVEDEVDHMQEGITDLGDEVKNLAAAVGGIEGKVHNLQSQLHTGLTSLAAEIKATVANELATVQNNMNMTFQELKEQLTAIAHQSSRESQDVKATLQTGITEVESVCNSSHEAGNQLTHIAAQYLPSSCSELERSPSGYYRIRNPFNGVVETVYCDTKTSEQNPSLSCQSLADRQPLTPSGYYWVNGSTGSAVNVYCDMERRCCGSTGGWMRVAYLDMTDPSQQCPSGFTLRTYLKRVCEKTVSPGCTSITFPAHGVQCSRVCGQTRAYQESGPDAFGPYYNGYSDTIEGTYVDGISVTHGRSPRKHIWTFAAAIDEVASHDRGVCPCTKTDAPYTGLVPPFVGTDYFCETGSRESAEGRTFYHEDPLWDGEGCGPTSSCCQFNSPPWFCKELPQPTTDDIEVRVCTNQDGSNEDVAIELIELYLQ